MKGFPNQVAELSKLAIGMQSLAHLVDSHADAKDDGIFGQALVWAGVAGTGHTPIPPDEYIRQQLLKPPGNQSFRTTARGLRELYRLMDFIDDSGSQVTLTDLGRQAVSYAGLPMNFDQIEFWRRAIRNILHSGGGEISHPYQVLLKLVGQKPGITRAKCALALEARNDSPEELTRIVALADLSEQEIQRRIRVTKSNWDNAKKVLPAFAEQLRDVIRDGQSFVLADAPGRADVGTTKRTIPKTSIRAPRTSRRVTSTTIGHAATVERSDEVAILPVIDPATAAKAIKVRFDRLRRHNLIVQELANLLRSAELYENPFDLLALVDAIGFLIEVKTLDGTNTDERDRVRDALGQLLYYEAFVISPLVRGTIHKIACFECSISVAHRDFFNRSGIGTIWKVNGGGFAGDTLATSMLGTYIRLR